MLSFTGNYNRQINRFHVSTQRWNKRQLIQGTVRELGQEALDIARDVTHVDTGALQSSHNLTFRSSFAGKGLRATISLMRSVRNPLHGEYTYKYGITEHERGNSHAFYAITFSRLTLSRVRNALNRFSSRMRLVWR